MGLVRSAWVRSSGGLRLCQAPDEVQDGGRVKIIAPVLDDRHADHRTTRGCQARRQTLRRRPQVFRGRGVLPNVVKDAAYVRQHSTDACLHAIELAEHTFTANLLRLEDLHLQEKEVQGLTDVVVKLPRKVNVPTRSRSNRTATLPDCVDGFSLICRNDHPNAPSCGGAVGLETPQQSDAASFQTLTRYE